MQTDFMQTPNASSVGILSAIRQIRYDLVCLWDSRMTTQLRFADCSHQQAPSSSSHRLAKNDPWPHWILASVFGLGIKRIPYCIPPRFPSPAKYLRPLMPWKRVVDSMAVAGEREKYLARHEDKIGFETFPIDDKLHSPTQQLSASFQTLLKRTWFN